MKDYHLDNILLIEDDLDDIEMFKEACAAVCAETNLVIAVGCEEAIKYFQQTDIVLPELIFMDLSMRKTDGFECLKLIKSMDKFNSVPVIVLSESAFPSQLDLLYNSGVNYFITKPASFGKLKDAIDKTVNTPAIFESHSRESFHIDL